MALPTSTVVFAIATVVTFGVAIWDGEHDAPLARAVDSVPTVDWGRAERPDFEERRQAERVGGLLGDRGEPGVLLHDLDGPVDETLQHRLDVLRRSGFVVTPMHDDGKTTTLVVQLEEAACQRLAEVLASSWGAGTAVHGRQIWMSTFSGRAAFVPGDDCRLRFDAVASPGLWINRSQKGSLVPIAALGQPAQVLIDRLGDRAAVTGFEIKWTTMGIGRGWGPTTVVAELRDGKVASLRASVDTDDDTRRAIAGQLQNLTDTRPLYEELQELPALALGRDTEPLVLTVTPREE